MHTTFSFLRLRRAALVLLVAFTSAAAFAQMRDDNRRLFWNGSGGAVWNDAAASWQPSGSYLDMLTTATAAWVDACKTAFAADYKRPWQLTLGYNRAW